MRRVATSSSLSPALRYSVQAAGRPVAPGAEARRDGRAWVHDLAARTLRAPRHAARPRDVRDRGRRIAPTSTTSTSRVLASNEATGVGVHRHGDVDGHADGRDVHIRLRLHPSSMRGSFTAGTPPPPATPTPSTGGAITAKSKLILTSGPAQVITLKTAAGKTGEGDEARDVHRDRSRSRANPQRPRRRAGLQP